MFVNAITNPNFFLQKKKPLRELTFEELVCKNPRQRRGFDLLEKNQIQSSDSESLSSDDDESESAS